MIWRNSVSIILNITKTFKIKEGNLKKKKGL